MGGRQSTPQEASFERADRGERGFSMQFSPDLVRALAQEGGVPGIAPPTKQPAKEKQEAEERPAPPARESVAVRGKTQQHNIEQLLKQAREEGFKQGKVAAEAEQDERSQRVQQELMEKEAARLAEQEVASATLFSDLADSLDAKYGTAKPKERPCNADYQATYQCYVKNGQRPLNCADEVKKFQECAQKATKAFLTSQ